MQPVLLQTNMREQLETEHNLSALYNKGIMQTSLRWLLGFWIDRLAAYAQGR